MPLALAACDGWSGNDRPDGTTVGQLIVPDGPTGYRVAVDRALSVDEVASATSSNPIALARTLARTGFRGGYERVWISGDAYLSDVAVETDTAFAAQDLLQSQAQQLAAGRGVVPYVDNDIPGARAFDFFGTTRQGGRQVFCNAVQFSVEADVFVLDDCNSAPRSADRVLSAARTQYERAATLLHVSVATP